MDFINALKVFNPKPSERYVQCQQTDMYCLFVVENVCFLFVFDCMSVFVFVWLCV